jgi:hypothetical protein
MKERLVGLRGVPGDPIDIGTADADIGKLSITQARQFGPALVVTLPLPDQADKIGKHSEALSHKSGHRPMT